MTSHAFRILCLSLGTSLLMAAPFAPLAQASPQEGAAAAPVSATETHKEDPFYGHNLSGRYLSSLFAQRHHDWKTANSYLEDMVALTPEDQQLIKRQMVLAMGSGNFDTAVALAEKTLEQDSANTLAHLFITAGAFKEKDYAQAAQRARNIPSSSLAVFMQPLLESWADAAVGQNNTAKLDKNTIHIHHAILIADYLKKFEQVEHLLQKTLDQGNLAPHDLERIGDIYAHIKQNDKARKMYEQALKDAPGDIALAEKIEGLKKGDNISYFASVKSVEHGVALAFYDMAQMLYAEGSDDSARIFAYLSINLAPEMTDANLLLAEIYARNERMDEAINYYLQISPDHEYYLDAQRRAADLLEDSGETERAKELLTKLSDQHQDIEARIKIGDIYRRKDDFANALAHYNQAAQKLGQKIPSDFWHLYYVRGMSYERTGEWEKAEKDLRAALEYQPDHPFVLNYLGYAWADQGQNLNEALYMIEKAVTLRPNDGYITDSLGWVYYRMGQYEKAVPLLEQAVALLPYDAVINDHLGDAYWQVGRKLEASFQWQRARNHTEDGELLQALETKLVDGLGRVEVLKEAHKLGAENPPIKN
jgi:tetratricopeptide (TPR) repeat protein